MNTGTDTRSRIDGHPCESAEPCGEFALRFHESLYSQGSHFDARFFRAAREGKQLSGNLRRKYDSRADATSVKNDLASFRRIMRHPIRLIYCQGQGKERLSCEIAATGSREPWRQWGGRTERCDETRSGKRSGEQKERVAG